MGGKEELHRAHPEVKRFNMVISYTTYIHIMFLTVASFGLAERMYIITPFDFRALQLRRLRQAMERNPCVGGLSLFSTPNNACTGPALLHFRITST